MARTPFFPESVASDFRVILVFWEACWLPGWDPKCPREPLYWSYSETCLRVTVGCKLQVMWKVSGMELCFPRALVSCHQEESCPLTRGVVCQRLTFHERPREPAPLHHQHATPEFLHKALFAVVPPLSTQQMDWNTPTLFSACVHCADQMHAHWIFLSQFVTHLYFRVYMYGCTCVRMDSLI